MTPTIKAFTFLLLCGSLLLSGCAQSVSFSTANKSSVHGASVAKRSRYLERDQMVIRTAGQNMAIALGGVVGALAAEGAASDDRSQLAAFLKANKIDSGLIMAGAFEAELKKAPLWSPSTGSTDATFEFNVERFGLAIRHGFTARLSPFIAGEGKLVRRDGTVLWKRFNFTHDGEVRHSLEEYLQQPAVLRAALEAAARSLSRQFLRELHVQSGGRDPIAAEDRAQEDARDAQEDARDAQEEAREREEDAAREAQKREKAAAKRQRQSS